MQESLPCPVVAFVFDGCLSTTFLLTVFPSLSFFLFLLFSLSLSSSLFLYLSFYSTVSFLKSYFFTQFLFFSHPMHFHCKKFIDMEEERATFSCHFFPFFGTKKRRRLRERERGREEEERKREEKEVRESAPSLTAIAKVWHHHDDDRFKFIIKTQTEESQVIHDSCARKNI